MSDTQETARLSSNLYYPSHMHLSLHRVLIKTVACCLWAFMITVGAQPSSLVLGRDTSVYKTEQVQAQLQVYAPQGLKAGSPMWLGVALHHKPGWHTYWKNPGDTGLPTHFIWKTPSTLSVGETVWPLPEKIQVGDLTNLGFEGDTLLLAPMKFTGSLNNPTEKFTISVHASWLVCQNECIPQEGDLSLELNTHASLAQHSTAFENVLSQQPRTLQSLQAQAKATTPSSLEITVKGLPASIIGNPMEILSEEAELIDAKGEHAKGASVAWSAEDLIVRVPFHEMRSSSPRHWTLFLIESPRPKGRPPVSFTVPVSMSGEWPAIPSGLTDSSVEEKPLSQMTNTAPQSAPEQGLFMGALLAALLGGLILNLMPCVLPVLALKAMAYTRASATPRAHLYASLLYTLGVVLSLLALGGLVFGLRAAGQQVGWGFQLQSPWVIASLALLFTLIALNLWGVFEVGAQVQSLAGNFQSRHGWLDSFGSGVLAVAVASPCTAPFMGASVGLAFGLPTWQGLSIFACLGLGLSLPILLLGLVPQTASFIPKPGPWMESLRKALGFPMLGTVIWLLWVLGHLSGIDASSTLLTILLLMCFGVWLQSRAHPIDQARDSGTIQNRLGLLIVLVALVLGCYWLIELESESSNPATISKSAPSKPTALWQPWSQDLVEQTLAKGQPVFIDYTAKWCITCQVNKASTLKNAQVLESFKAHQVQLFEADWTRQDPAITASLKSLGRSGVPVYVLLSPNREARVLSEVLTPSMLLKELDSL